MDTDNVTLTSAPRDLPPAARLQWFIDNHRLVRRTWGNGYSRACLLAAMAPVCAEELTACACPASVMPNWLAFLTPDIDDCGSVTQWEDMVQRYARAAARWRILDAPAWDAVYRQVCADCIEYVCATWDGDDRRIALRVVAWFRSAERSEHVAARLQEEIAGLPPRYYQRLYTLLVRQASMTSVSLSLFLRGHYANLSLRDGDALWDLVTDCVLSAIEAACAKAEAVQ